MFRGEKEEILDLQMLPEPVAATPAAVSSYELKIMQRFAISDQGRPGDKWLAETVRSAWRTRIQVHLNADLRMRLWDAAEQEAIRVFASNLRDLLLAAPAGARLRTILRHGSLESTVDRITPGAPSESERMYDSGSESDDS